MTLTTVSPQRTYALVVGIEKYNAGPSWNLDGPASDARNFADWLCSRGVPAKNIFLFLSPLDKNSQLASPRFAEQEALQQNVSRTITDVLPQQEGDLLCIFWGGHGMITAQGERRLFYADATHKNKRNLDLKSLLLSLRSDFLRSFPQQIYIVDACANYIADPRLPIVAGETFCGGPPRKGCEQFVLLAAKTGEVAKNVTTRQTGLFSEAMMEELAQEADSSWPPNMEKLANNLENRFKRLRQAGSAQQTPTYLWFRDWDEREDSLGNVPSSWKPSMKHSFCTVLLVSVVTTSLLMGLRHQGWLQPLELLAFDHMMRLRPLEQPDERLLAVEVTKEDISRYEYPLADETLALLLEKLEQYQPRVIGLDIYRGRPVGRGYRRFVARLQQDARLVIVCQASGGNDPDTSPPADPDGILIDRLGFSDVVVDPDDIIRRHLLFQNLDGTSSCDTPNSLSYQLALHYLDDVAGIQPNMVKEQMKWGNVIFKRLETHTSGYQGVDAHGYQVMLNYRHTSSPIARTVTLTDILSDRIRPDWVRGKIVLIGVTAPSVKDDFSTPFGQQTDRKLRGLFIHAQMVSQIVSAVLNQRPLLWTWSYRGEVLWLWSWSLVGGILAWRSPTPLILGLAGAAALGTLYGLCFVFFMESGWVPLVPSALLLIATGGSIATYIVLRTNSNKPL